MNVVQRIFFLTLLVYNSYHKAAAIYVSSLQTRPLGGSFDALATIRERERSCTDVYRIGSADP